MHFFLHSSFIFFSRMTIKGNELTFVVLYIERFADDFYVK